MIASRAAGIYRYQLPVEHPCGWNLGGQQLSLVIVVMVSSTETIMRPAVSIQKDVNTCLHVENKERSNVSCAILIYSNWRKKLEIVNTCRDKRRAAGGAVYIHN